MARKNYSDEFRRRAVDLFESTPGATITAIAGDLGVSRGALKAWVDRYGTGTTTPAPGAASAAGKPESQAARIARLEAENKALRAEHTKLEEERDILRSAAKYFAGETNW